MKRKILAGIAILSIAVITSLNVYAGDWQYLTEADNQEGGGSTNSSYPYIEQIRCGDNSYYQRCNKGTDEKCDVSKDQFPCLI